MVVGGEHVRSDRDARLFHAGGKSYVDLVRRRRGDADDAPDAVVLPATHEQVGEVLAVCADAGIAVVPFGGGTSVVGGVEPLRGGFAAVIALDLSRLNRLLSVDVESLTAVFEPGVRGPQAETLLAGHGLTLGHLPQSFEHASLGGYVATRSAGQASTGYGRIDDLVLALRCATPVGELRCGRPPASAAGPDLRALLVGSEGTLGVLTEVTLQVTRIRASRRYEAWFFRSFTDGAGALRALVQDGGAPDLARLSDVDETRVSMALGGTGGVTAGVGHGYLRVRGYAGGCLALVGWEGTGTEVRQRRRTAIATLRHAGGLPVGSRPAKSWLHGRFAGPYLRDQRLDRGVLVETLETAAPWSRLLQVHATVRAALTDTLTARGATPLVLCHVSHLYPSGASLYFTVLARQERGREIEQWEAAKAAAGNAITSAAATITHHHAVGADHRRWMRDEVGELGIAALQAMKRRLDPVGIMNPGKLLPDEADGEVLG